MTPDRDDILTAVRAWLRKGDNDLRSARVLLDLDMPITDVVCFHSQQAAEKYLKAFLVYHGTEPPYVHSLTTLLDLCERHDPSLAELSTSAEMLNPFAVHVRYPLAEEPPDEAAATQALEHAERICQRVADMLDDLHR